MPRIGFTVRSLVTEARRNQAYWNMCDMLRTCASEQGEKPMARGPNVRGLLRFGIEAPRQPGSRRREAFLNPKTQVFYVKVQDGEGTYWSGPHRFERKPLVNRPGGSYF